MICPLCLHHESDIFCRDKKRQYNVCRSCSLVFVPRNELISPSLEKSRYESHENDENRQYQNYLSIIADAISQKLPAVGFGLDFGCGRTNLLANLLRNKGHEVISYDIFFYPAQNYLESQYDFIIMSEVIEHLREPSTELEKIKELLNPDGILFIKTKLLPETLKEFENWFYKRDMTHVQFFSNESLSALSALLGLSQPETIGEDLYLFRNNR